MNIADYIDHTVLHADCTPEDIQRVCSEAAAHRFKAVCVPPYYVRDAVQQLKDSFVKVATVVGFPMGYSPTAAKVEEIKRAIDEDADELDVVINLCAIRQSNWNFVSNDIDTVTTAVHLKGKVVKVILETALLNEDEILKLCEICNSARPDFVKTSTGKNGGGATLEAVRLLRANLDPAIQIKASGGIRTKEAAVAFIEAGATRLGTSSSLHLISEPF